MLTALSAAWKKLPAFEPDRRTAAGVPWTVGELLRWKSPELPDDGEVFEMDRPDRTGTALAWHRMDESRVRRSARPVDLRSLLLRPRANLTCTCPPEVYRFAPIRRDLIAAYKFLKRLVSRRTLTNALDQPLSGIEAAEDLRLMVLLGRQIDRQCGIGGSLETLYGWPMMGEDLREWHGSVYLPVWEWESFDSSGGGGILDVLELIRDVAHYGPDGFDEQKNPRYASQNLPEYAYELDLPKLKKRQRIKIGSSARLAEDLADMRATYDGMPLDELSARLRRIIARGPKAAATLGPGWAKAVRFLATYRGIIQVYDFGEMEPCTVRDFDGYANLVSDLHAVIRMQRATVHLVNDYTALGDAWWQRLFERLLKAPATAAVRQAHRRAVRPRATHRRAAAGKDAA